MTTKINFATDVGGRNTFAPYPASDKYSATLTSGGNATVTVPNNFQEWIVSFSYQPGSDMWVAYNATAAVPAGATFATTTSELLPGARAINAYQADGVTRSTINIYNNTASSQDVGVIFYAIA
jgi:hypothetical protein